MLKIDEAGYNQLRQSHVSVGDETREDLLVRLEVYDRLQAKQYDNMEAIDNDICALFEEQGREASQDDIARIKGNMLEKARGNLALDIARDEAIARYQSHMTFKDGNGNIVPYADVIAAEKEQLEKITNDANSYFEDFFKGRKIS